MVRAGQLENYTKADARSRLAHGLVAAMAQLPPPGSRLPALVVGPSERDSVDDSGEDQQSAARARPDYRKAVSSHADRRHRAGHGRRVQRNRKPVDEFAVSGRTAAEQRVTHRAAIRLRLRSNSQRQDG